MHRVRGPAAKRGGGALTYLMGDPVSETSCHSLSRLGWQALWTLVRLQERGLLQMEELHGMKGPGLQDPLP